MLARPISPPLLVIVIRLLHEVHGAAHELVGRKQRLFANARWQHVIQTEACYVFVFCPVQQRKYATNPSGNIHHQRVVTAFYGEVRSVLGDWRSGGKEHVDVSQGCAIHKNTTIYVQVVHFMIRGPSHLGRLRVLGRSFLVHVGVPGRSTCSFSLENNDSAQKKCVVHLAVVRTRKETGYRETIWMEAARISS